jgi:hypothetical protein
VSIPNRYLSLSFAASPAARSSTPRFPRFWQSASQDPGENDGVVVLAVVGGIDEGKRAVPSPAPQLREPRALLAKLLGVAAAELLKAAWFVPKPLPQLGAWSKLALPLIEAGLVARDAARPEAVDQDSIAVRRRRGLIRALQADVHWLAGTALLSAHVS